MPANGRLSTCPREVIDERPGRGVRSRLDHVLGRQPEGAGELEPEHRVAPLAVLLIPQVVQQQLAHVGAIRTSVDGAQEAWESQLEAVVLARVLLQALHRERALRPRLIERVL